MSAKLPQTISLGHRSASFLATTSAASSQVKAQFSPLDKLCEAEGVELVEGLEAASSGLFSTRQLVEGMVADSQKKGGPVSHHCHRNMMKDQSSQ